MIPVNSVVVSTRATIGRLGINRIPLTTNQGFKNIVIKDTGLVIPEFLAFMMTNLKISMENLASGGTFKEISKTNFETLSIPLPPIEVQKQIVEELEGYQNIIDGCRQVVDNYKPIIDIDPSWDLVKLGKILEIVRGGSPRPIKDFITDGDGVNWIKISDASSSSKYIFETKEKITYEGVTKSREVKEGDFILSNSMSFGRPYIMRTSGCIHDGWLLLRYNKEQISEDYLYYILSSKFVYDQFVRLATGGVVNNLNKELVSSVVIPKIGMEEQNQISSLLEVERKIVDGNKRLIEIYTQKIQDRISKVWGD
jgi:type I restriction enzyme M protein